MSLHRRRSSADKMLNERYLFDCGCAMSCACTPSQSASGQKNISFREPLFYEDEMSSAYDSKNNHESQFYLDLSSSHAVPSCIAEEDESDFSDSDEETPGLLWKKCDPEKFRRKKSLSARRRKALQNITDQADDCVDSNFQNLQDQGISFQYPSEDSSLPEIAISENERPSSPLRLAGVAEFKMAAARSHKMADTASSKMADAASSKMAAARSHKMADTTFSKMAAEDPFNIGVTTANRVEELPEEDDCCCQGSLCPGCPIHGS